jgi:hypothetical protein
LLNPKLNFFRTIVLLDLVDRVHPKNINLIGNWVPNSTAGLAR